MYIYTIRQFKFYIHSRESCRGIFAFVTGNCAFLVLRCFVGEYTYSAITSAVEKVFIVDANESQDIIPLGR